jgi:hypothetical protein
LADEATILEWSRKNDESYETIKGFRLLRCQELTVTKTVSFNLSAPG